MLKTRLWVAALGIPLCLGITWYGGWLLEIFIILLAIIALSEYNHMIKAEKARMMPLLGIGMMLNLLLGFYHGGDVRYTGWLILLGTIVISVLRYPYYKGKDLAYSLLGGVYVGFFFGYAIWMGYQPHHFVYLLLVFFLAWGNDSGGYIFGRLFGRTKLTPLLSPKKTVAGAVGGVALATVAVFVLNLFLPQSFAWLPLLGFCLLGSVAAQTGDLFASLLKRHFGVKDAGKIIPGHGGVLDRFDSFLAILPVVYYFVQWMEY